MKRILATIALLLFAGNAFGAGTCDLQAYAATNHDDMAYVTYRCTAHTDNSLSYAFSDAEMKYLDGGYLYYALVKPATATTCTNDSDISLTDEFGQVPYTAAGNGLNLVHSTNTTGSIPENLSNADWYYPTLKKNNMTIAMTNNSVASCTFDITFIMDRR